MYKKLSLTESKKLISGIKISSILIQFTFLAFPLSMYIVYNKVIASKNPNTLILVLIFLISILVIQLILKITESIQQSLLKVDQEIKKHEDFLNNKFNTTASHQKYNLSELNQLNSDVNTNIQGHISNGYYLFMIIYFGLILLIGKYLIIIPVIMYGINYLIAKQLASNFELHNQNFNYIYSDKTNFIKDILQKVKTIKGLGIKRHIINKYDDLSFIANREKCMCLYTKNTILKVSMVINIINIAFILLLGRYLYSLDILNIEQIITCSLLTMWMSRSVAQVFTNLKPENLGTQSINNNTILKAKSIDDQTYNKIKNSLTNQNLTLYSASHPYDLYNIYMRMKDEYKWVSYIDYNSNLFYGTIIDNMTMFDKTREEFAKELAKHLQISHLVNNLPYKFNYVATGSTDEALPHDLKVGITIIRELITKPQILIINIDKQRISKQMFDNIVTYATKNKVKIICSHKEQSINKIIRNTA